jgi:transcriptional regulator with XRE-family HTH domain
MGNDVGLRLTSSLIRISNFALPTLKSVLPVSPRFTKARPTQKDIADVAQVSQATVSLVLNGVGESSVPLVTQRKVFRAAKNLGYAPNRVAQSLRTQRTKTIACIVPDITNPFYPALERGAQKSAKFTATTY